jgi:hypothetical protein
MSSIKNNNNINKDNNHNNNNNFMKSHHQVYPFKQKNTKNLNNSTLHPQMFPKQQYLTT